MELSLAVTNSVADLMKKKIFCTEVFRIPLAGQVDVCCFDKTGTLTSDEMQLKGVRLPVTEDNGEEKGNKFTDVLEPSPSLPWTALRVMAACHSLAVTGRGAGDKAAQLIGDPLEKAVLEMTGYTMIQNNALRTSNTEAEIPETILILQRFGFSSRLKRMSVLVREAGSDKTWVLTKGAPETLKNFLRPNSLPSNYDEISMYHMALGQRVLAMAYRELTTEEIGKSLNDIDRDSIESNLIFAGFLLLHCPVKHDSKSVVSELCESGNKVVMITGDAILTAVEVARQVGIIRKKSKQFPPTLQLKHFPSTDKVPQEGVPLSEFRFVPFSENSTEFKSDGDFTLTPSALTRLQKRVDFGEIALCISGDTLQKLALNIVQGIKQTKSTSISSEAQMKDDKQILLHPEAQAVLRHIVPLISVFARHAPRQKEAIVAAFNLGGSNTLMVGDGTNDVGALRRAHIGISIISAPEVEAKQRSAAETISKVKAEQKKDRKKKGNKTGSRAKPKSSALEESLRQLQEAQDELDQVELGDASIAAPFTSRMVSIKCCKDVLQQGRCTLVTMLQIYKILGVNCLVNAMILSKLFLHGVKQGDRQMTILGLIVAGLFFFVTRGKPLPTLSTIKPPTSVLCTQAILSITLQFGIHYTSMIIATEAALSFVDPFDPSMIPDGPFNPNTLNTCTFLVSVLATVNTFAVNYRGEPFVEPLRKNTMLWRSLQICYGLLFACALEVFPPLNDLFQLAEFPDTVGEGGIEWTNDEGYVPPHSSLPFVSSLNQIVQCIGFPLFISGLMACDTILTFVSERVILQIFEATATKKA